ncbi:DNA sulfur modification protein DndD [Halocatena pleomorpha]|uniref:DNA sulfur modification protein DndD n=1 Tax=Halocatena pleomorpha TaxID=1785090 RepID=A0A3P3R8C6_9EURY|nr:DNA sulfur modification protein DndD [Halocatena pleomorpha]RRJ28793.1 DNA sulfur modification protein DndD [Halocatena pleomorpha]
MKFNKLVIEDFGPYRGQNELDLTTTDNSPIILFGGQNGAGKTTLFEAIRFCLHGRSALGRRVAMREYHQTVRSRLHEYPDGKAETASVRIEFEYAHLGEKDYYSVERTWRDRGKSIVENLEMRRNGKIPTELDKDQWQDFLQQLVPPGVSQLFFFDGEKIQELASAVESDDSFTDSMYSLLGLDLVDRLDTDLSIYVSQKLDSSGVEGINDELEDYREEKEALEEEIERLGDEKFEKKEELDTIQDEINEIEAKIASEGGSYANRRDDLKERRAELKASIESHEGQIEEIVTGIFPFTLAPDLCKNVVERLQEETEQQNQRTAKEELTKELDDVLEEDDVWEDLGVSEGDVNELTTRIRSKLEGQFDHDGDDPQLAHQFSRAQRQDIYSVVDRAMNDVPQQFAEANHRTEADVRELQEVESSLSKAPDQSVISPMIDELNELTEEMGSLKNEIEGLESEISTLQNKLETVNSRIQSKLDEKSRLEDVSERANLASDVRKAIEDYRDELAKEKLGKLEEVLSDRYLTLSNKSDFYKEIQIDEDTLDISLITRHGSQKPHTELSAGERQIFATSLLWALAEISGRPLPFIIDTPLGRLDQRHRNNLIKRFFPEASHQVLIFSTDTEIDDQQYEVLSRDVAKAYHLEYDETEGVTVPTEGYFWDDDTDQTSPEEITS